MRKQAHVYGRLDPGPLQLDLGIGFGWDISGWLLTPFLASLPPDEFVRMRERVAAGLTTTFASTYGAEIGLDDGLDPEVIAGFAGRGTGAKYLITPDGQSTCSPYISPSGSAMSSMRAPSGSVK